MWQDRAEAVAALGCAQRREVHIQERPDEGAGPCDPCILIEVSRYRPVLIPPPLCKVVRCDDLERLTLDEALRELQKTDEVEVLRPNIYAVRYDFGRITPSMINDYEYCPRLLWVQARLGRKFLTRRSLVALIRGRLLHERYERMLSAAEDVLPESPIALGDMVGVVDLVFRRNEKMLPPSS
jgi:CRISPR-associated exonuclease, Cas4 family